MKLLLDSHVFLWLLNDPEKLGRQTKIMIEDQANDVCVSTVSIWELGLKYKKEKQPYSIIEMLEGVIALQARLLELKEVHLARFERIELPHRDPIDVLLVAQSEAEHGLFLTVDNQILASHYKAQDAGK